MTTLTRRASWVLVGAAALLALPASAGAAPIQFLQRSAFVQAQVGSITSADPVQVSRLNRNDPAGTCAAPQPDPGSSFTGARRFDAYTYRNPSASAICVTVRLNPKTCTGTSAIHSAAYLGSFNPANARQNYAADIGTSPADPKSYSFTVPAGQTFVVVVSETTAAGCAEYELTLSSDPDTPQVGSLDDAGPEQTGRLNRTDPPSTCASPQPNPGVGPGSPNPGGNRFELYRFRNTATTPVCVTAALDPKQCAEREGATQRMHSAAYLGRFNPANPGENYLGDIGESAAAPKSYSFTVPAGANYDVVVSVAGAEQCPEYELTVSAVPDRDGDGPPDNVDNCPTVPNPDQANSDGDAQGNACDPDDDNDGTPDGQDPAPQDAPAGLDTDGDGTPNTSDPDDDNDGVADGADDFPLSAAESADTDFDGLGNNADTDDDNDGAPDANDRCPTEFAGPPSGCPSPPDTTPPDTTVTSAPRSPTRDATPTFTFSSSEPGVSFQCKLRTSRDWVPCGSPFTLPVFGDGVHTFEVYAVDRANNIDPTFARVTFTLDTRAPTVERPSLRPSSFRVGQRGTAFRYRLREAATVTIVIERALPGRRRRFQRAGAITRRSRAGQITVPFTGRIGRRALVPGSYRATLTAVDAAGNRSRPARLNFTVRR